MAAITAKQVLSGGTSNVFRPSICLSVEFRTIKAGVKGDKLDLCIISLSQAADILFTFVLKAF